MIPALALVLLAQTTTVPPKDFIDRGEGDQRTVAFDDDPLVGGGPLVFGTSIRRPPGAVRVGLIRPRTTFVPSLLKSVENL